MEFADELLKYKENRTELIDKIKNVYNNIDIDLPTLERDNNGNKIDPYDIDPFTIFALFNKQISDTNKIKIIKMPRVYCGIFSVYIIKQAEYLKTVEIFFI